MATFIELGVGFNPDLTARDNVVINAIMLGLTPAEARERYDAVIDFAELHEFEDLKLKNYSSGMFVRLAFATMIQVDADVLLIDEVLAVGDVELPAQVPRGARRHPRARAHDPVRDARHADGRGEVRPRAAARARRAGRARATRSRWPAQYDQLNFSRQANARRGQGQRRGDGTRGGARRLGRGRARRSAPPPSSATARARST